MKPVRTNSNTFPTRIHRTQLHYPTYLQLCHKNVGPCLPLISCTSLRSCLFILLGTTKEAGGGSRIPSGRVSRSHVPDGETGVKYKKDDGQQPTGLVYLLPCGFHSSLYILCWMVYRNDMFFPEWFLLVLTSQILNIFHKTKVHNLIFNFPKILFLELN